VTLGGMTLTEWRLWVGWRVMRIGARIAGVTLAPASSPDKLDADFVYG
jgi:hypothetical protein